MNWYSSVKDFPLPKIAGLPKLNQILFGPMGLPSPLGALHLYALGWFPMADEFGDIDWYTTEERAILPLEGIHVSHSLAQRVRTGRFQVKINQNYIGVLRGCANREDSWINSNLITLYRRLREMKCAHSVEAWRDGQLVGGLFGVTLGQAFIGESMFSVESDASNVCLVHLAARLAYGGFTLHDVQEQSEHLQTLGAVTMPGHKYAKILFKTVGRKASFEAMPSDIPAAKILELAREKP